MTAALGVTKYNASKKNVHGKFPILSLERKCLENWNNPCILNEPKQKQPLKAKIRIHFCEQRESWGPAAIFWFLQRHFGSLSRSPDLSLSRWRWCYKTRRSFPVYLASEVQKQSNAPVTGLTLSTVASKSRSIPLYVPGVSPRDGCW